MKDSNPELAKEVLRQELLKTLTFSSHKETEWVCSKGHVYELSPNHRQSDRGCPYCAGRKVYQGFNDISAHPEIAKDLAHPEDSNVADWSRDPIRWRHTAEDGAIHEWAQSPSSRIFGAGCLVCVSKIVVPGANDVAATHQKIAEQWAVGNALKPSEVTYGSSEIVLFVCPNGHSWRSKLKNATQGRAVCQDCIPKDSKFRSKGEIEVLEFLKEKHPELEFETNVRRFRENGIFEYDIFNSERKVAVEFNGIHWHKEQFKGEGYHARKRAASEELGITLLEVWEDFWKESREEIEDALILAFSTHRAPEILSARIGFS